MHFHTVSILTVVISTFIYGQESSQNNSILKNIHEFSLIDHRMSVLLEAAILRHSYCIIAIFINVDYKDMDGFKTRTDIFEKYNCQKFNFYGNNNIEQNWSDILTTWRPNLVYIKVYIFIHLETSKMNELLTWLRSNKFITPYQNYLYVGSNFSQPTNIGEVFRRHHIVNFLIAKFTNVSNTIDLDLFTYEPYSGDNCNEIMTLLKINFHRNLTEFYTKKIPNHLNNCPLRILTSVYEPYIGEPQTYLETSKSWTITSGVEVDMMKMLSKIAGLKVYYTLDFNAVWKENGTDFYPGNIFIRLQNEEVDLVMCSVILTPLRNKYFEFSKGYYVELDKLCVPKAEKKPEWLKVWEFLYIQGISIIPMIGLTIVTWFLIKVMKYIRKQSFKERKKFTKPLDIFFIYFGTWLTSPISQSPRTDSIRLVFITWLIYVLLYNTFCLTLLYHLLKTQQYDKQITSKLDLVDSDLDLMLPDNYERYFSNSSVDVQLLEKKHHCPDMIGCLLSAVRNKSAAVGVQMGVVLYDEYEFNINGESKIFCFPEYLQVTYLRLMMYRNHPLLPRLDHLVSTSFEAGIVDRYMKNTLYQRNFLMLHKLRKSREGVTFEEDVVFMRFDHLITIFYCYFCGILLSTFVFCVEKYRGRKTINKYY